MTIPASVPFEGLHVGPEWGVYKGWPYEGNGKGPRVTLGQEEDAAVRRSQRMVRENPWEGADDRWQ